MSAITTCPRCGRCYFAASEEAANEPDRECYSCWEGSKPAEDGAAIAAEKGERLLAARQTREHGAHMTTDNLLAQKIADSLNASGV